MDRRPAVFVDRDDTIMVDVGYCRDPNLVRLIPGAAEGLSLLKEAGFPIIIVTNQSGIGRKYFDRKSLDSVNERLRRELGRHGAGYDAIYYCPHTPEDNCECRKPKPGLLFRAALDLGLDLPSSYTIGDRDLDVQAGKSAGTHTVLVSSDSKQADAEEEKSADFLAGNLVEAAHLILSHSRDQAAGEEWRSRSRSSQG